MKQILIVDSTTLLSGSGLTSSAMTTTNKGKVGFALLSAPETGIAGTVALTDDFSIIVSRGINMPLRFDEVNFKSLKVTKSAYQAGTTFKGTITIPTPSAVGVEYMFTIVKKGAKFNERANWTFSDVAKATTAAEATRIAAKLVTAINTNKETLGVTAVNSNGIITVTATEAGPDYEVKSELCTTAVTTAGKKAELDDAYVKELALACAAGKGFEYNYADGESIYPGFPESVSSANDAWTMWTLQFAVPREASKTRDEVVKQVVHIVMPEATAGTALTTLDVLLGITAPTSA